MTCQCQLYLIAERLSVIHLRFLVASTLQSYQYYLSDVGEKDYRSSVLHRSFDFSRSLEREYDTLSYPGI